MEREVNGDGGGRKERREEGGLLIRFPSTAPKRTATCRSHFSSSSRLLALLLLIFPFDLSSYGRDLEALSKLFLHLSRFFFSLLFRYLHIDYCSNNGLPKLAIPGRASHGRSFRVSSSFLQVDTHLYSEVLPLQHLQPSCLSSLLRRGHSFFYLPGEENVAKTETMHTPKEIHSKYLGSVSVPKALG